MMSQFDKAGFAGDRKKKVLFAQLKVNYERAIKTDGENKETTILAGFVYSSCLDIENKCIESERLLTKLSTSSRRILGPEHQPQ